MNPEKMADLIKEKLSILNPTFLDVIDESNEHIGHAHYQAQKSTHFAVIIASEELKKYSRLNAHRAIYRALKPLLENKIHALRIVLKNNKST